MLVISSLSILNGKIGRIRQAMQGWVLKGRDTGVHIARQMYRRFRLQSRMIDVLSWSP